jgi:hypothetical protein
MTIKKKRCLHADSNMGQLAVASDLQRGDKKCNCTRERARSFCKLPLTDLDPL